MTPDEIAELGADVDVKAIMEEVRAEIARKLESGTYPPEIIDELDRQAGRPTSIESLKAGIAALRRSIPFSIEARITSSRPALTPVVSRVKRTIYKSVAWYMATIVEQINDFSARSVSMLDQLLDRSNALEKRIEELEDALREKGDMS